MNGRSKEKKMNEQKPSTNCSLSQIPRFFHWRTKSINLSNFVIFLPKKMEFHCKNGLSNQFIDCLCVKLLFGETNTQCFSIEFSFLFEFYFMAKAISAISETKLISFSKGKKC